jgi:hypothetical protein
MLLRATIPGQIETIDRTPLCAKRAVGDNHLDHLPIDIGRSF